MGRREEKLQPLSGWLADHKCHKSPEEGGQQGRVQKSPKENSSSAPFADPLPCSWCPTRNSGTRPRKLACGEIFTSPVAVPDPWVACRSAVGRWPAFSLRLVNRQLNLPTRAPWSYLSRLNVRGKTTSTDRVHWVGAIWRMVVSRWRPQGWNTVEFRSDAT